jgi:hypothetical protein
VTKATRQAVEQQAAILNNGLRREPQVRNQLRAATRSPLDRFPDYLPPYAVALDGRTLSERVISAAAETSRKVRLLLRELLAAGLPVREIDATLRQFMTGTLKAKRKPYGTTARFDAARLLRGETTRAYGAAGLTSAALNPFILSVDWVTSARHSKIDICDDHARNSPYAVDAVPPYPSHAHCLCYLRYRIDGRTQAVVNRLRESDLLNVRGALSPGFADLLLRSSGDQT